MSAESDQTAVLLVTCPDAKGIVASLAQVLHGHGANILDADQHTDPVAGQFFQRIRFSQRCSISSIATQFIDDVYRVAAGTESGKADFLAVAGQLRTARAQGKRVARVAFITS